MEQKKTRSADIDQRRTTGFLLGLVFVLSIFYVSLEWNSVDSDDGIDPIDLDELMHESELVPMSNEELTSRIEEKQEAPKTEQLHVVDDQVELQSDDVEAAVEGEGDDDEQLLQELQEEDDKALAALNVDPNNPLNFHIVEDLPKYPGGAVEFMKWLTRNLQYPPLLVLVRRRARWWLCSMSRRMAALLASMLPSHSPLNATVRPCVCCARCLSGNQASKTTNPVAPRSAYRSSLNYNFGMPS